MIKLMFTGDFCSKNPNTITISDNLKLEISSCDIKCVNFEMPLPVGKLQSPNGLKLVQSLESPSWIEENGFNLISLANNHMFDYGKDGVIATKDAFKKSTTFGSGTWQEAYEVKFIEISGVKFGFFSGTSADFASLKDNWTDKNKIGAAWINHKDVNKIITSAKANCDYLIVLSHGGIEYMDVPLPEWRDRYRELIDLGADAIIGSHPHVPQGIETYNEKPIFYSLGNFFFDNENKNKPKYWDNGVLAVLEVENSKLTFRQIPIIKNGDYLDVDLSKNTFSHLAYLSEILKNDKEYIDLVNLEVQRLYGKYMNWFLNSLRIFDFKFSIKSFINIFRVIFLTKKNEKISLHQIREESTRWLLLRALKLKSKTEL